MASRQAALILSLTLGALLTGCETTHDQLVAQGYPPAFADGFADGCSSGRQAAGVISGEFRKNVPRYLGEATYAGGWDDGFRQCQAQVRSEERREYEDRLRGRDDDAWERNRDNAVGRALHPD